MSNSDDSLWQRAWSAVEPARELSFWKGLSGDALKRASTVAEPATEPEFWKGLSVDAWQRLTTSWKPQKPEFWKVFVLSRTTTSATWRHVWAAFEPLRNLDFWKEIASSQTITDDNRQRLSTALEPVKRLVSSPAHQEENQPKEEVSKEQLTPQEVQQELTTPQGAREGKMAILVGGAASSRVVGSTGGLRGFTGNDAAAESLADSIHAGIGRTKWGIIYPWIQSLDGHGGNVGCVGYVAFPVGACVIMVPLPNDVGGWSLPFKTLRF